MASPEVKRYHARSLNSSSNEMRKEAVVSCISLPGILRRPNSEQRELAARYESKGSACDLFVAATILEMGLGDKKRSLSIMELAANKGSPSANLQLGGHYLEMKDVETAIKYYTKASELGSPVAQHKLGALYDFELPERDLEKALHFYTIAANNKNSDSMNNLAILVEDDGVECPEGWTLTRLRNEAAQRGSVDSKVALAKEVCPINEDTDPSIAKLALSYLWESFVESPSHATCSFLLGLHYMPREPSNPFGDPAKALFFFKRAKDGCYEGTVANWIEKLERLGKLKEKEPSTKFLLTSAMERVAKEVDKSYQASLGAAIAEFELLAPPNAAPTPNSLGEMPTQIEPLISTLVSCGFVGCDVTTDLKFCARCKVVAYCCREHQAAAWKAHKDICYK